MQPDANRNQVSLRVYWLQCTETDVPCDNTWLTPTEQLRLNSLKFPQRRRDWRLGRWTAKSAVRALELLEGRCPEFAEVEIQVLPSGAPRAYVRGVALSISLSHRDGTAICAASRSELPLGCDIEVIEPRSQAFMSDYFCAEERASLAAAPDEQQQQRMTTLFWSAKESALKALQLGLTMDVRRLRVLTDCVVFLNQSMLFLPKSMWHEMMVGVPNREVRRGWWSLTAKFVRTIVSEASEPLHLNVRTPI